MLTVDIENLNSMIREKENEISNREKEDAERENEARQDHDDLVKGIKLEMKTKQDKLTEILTTPKQLITQKK